jgi:hypothetical protein
VQPLRARYVREVNGIVARYDSTYMLFNSVVGAHNYPYLFVALVSGLRV